MRFSARFARVGRAAPAAVLVLASAVFAAFAATGCGAKKSAPPPVPAAPAASTAAAPVAPKFAPKFAASAEEFNPDSDPVLGWWRCDLAAGDPEQALTSKLWPVAGDDGRALRTIRFLNDGMATNGCCAGAHWGFAAPKFYWVERDIQEIYYAPDADTLYFLARTDAGVADTLFKKIIAAVGTGKPLEDLRRSGELPALVRFSRQRSVSPGI